MMDMFFLGGGGGHVSSSETDRSDFDTYKEQMRRKILQDSKLTHFVRKKNIAQFLCDVYLEPDGSHSNK
jgi:hypothetical protein